MRQTIRTMRQDGWTGEDDGALADVVLKHIRDGSTQLAGFNEASKRLGRTAAACGFRWNACVRKQYHAAIEVAKEERKERKSAKVQAQLEGGDYDHPTATLMSWAQVLRFLRQEKSTAQQWASRWRAAERQCAEWRDKYAKGGLISYTKALAKELARTNITVNAVAPGAIATDMIAALSPDDLEVLTDETPMGRIGTPEDIANAVLFLALPTSSFITGQVISPNGGLVT